MPEALRGDPDVGARLARMSRLVGRYAAPDERWRSWPSGNSVAPPRPWQSLQLPFVSSPRGHVPVHVPTESERKEESRHELENHLAEAAIGIGMDSPKVIGPAPPYG